MAPNHQRVYRFYIYPLSQARCQLMKSVLFSKLISAAYWIAKCLKSYSFKHVSCFEKIIN